MGCTRRRRNIGEAKDRAAAPSTSAASPAPASGLATDAEVLDLASNDTEDAAAAGEPNGFEVDDASPNDRVPDELPPPNAAPQVLVELDPQLVEEDVPNVDDDDVGAAAAKALDGVVLAGASAAFFGVSLTDLSEAFLGSSSLAGAATTPFWAASYASLNCCAMASSLNLIANVMSTGSSSE